VLRWAHGWLSCIALIVSSVSVFAVLDGGTPNRATTRNRRASKGSVAEVAAANRALRYVV
jgi:hypothetical protein